MTPSADIGGHVLRGNDHDSALGGGRTLQVAAIAGATAACLYYCQPVLASIGRSLRVSPDTAGLVVAAALVGNALAQLFVVPLVDRLERRRLSQAVLAVQLLGLLGFAAAPSLATAVVASAAIGAGAAGAMTLLPYAVGLADTARRGRVTGSVMSGVLFGILLSRSVSGFLSSWAGWRTTYLVAAALCAVSIMLLQRLPRAQPGGNPLRYSRLLRSLVEVVRGDRLVQRHMLLGALGFAVFNLVWTGLTLLLASQAYSFPDAIIGLFGLLGVAGALVARNAGRWHDQGHGRRSLLWGWTGITAAWAVMAAGAHGPAIGVVALVLGVLLLDAGMQAQHITNQSILLSARSARAGRVTTAYMGTNVLAGALGSAWASQLFPALGWYAVVVAGLCCGLAALVLLRLWPPRPSAPSETPTGHGARH